MKDGCGTYCVLYITSGNFIGAVPLSLQNTGEWYNSTIVWVIYFLPVPDRVGVKCPCKVVAPSFYHVSRWRTWSFRLGWSGEVKPVLSESEDQ